MGEHISIPLSAVRPDLIRSAAEQIESSNPPGAAILRELAAEQETAIELARIDAKKRTAG